MREFLFKIKKRFLASLKFLSRKLRRCFVNTKLTIESSFDVPIVINNRNRYTYLRDFVDWLQKAGYRKIIILDNDSHYPQLLEYYKNCPAKVIFLNQNVGYKALWQTDFFEEIKKGYYVYTDSDLEPDSKCPSDVVFRLYQILTKYAAEKCGPALKIDDLPEHYERKKEVVAFEKKHWAKSVETDVYDAPIDTTFALYKPFAYGDAEELKALRVGGDLTFRHLPWYENSLNPTPEDRYYKENVSSSSFWYNKKI